ncbi:MAG: T9SS C-terminal target domain-containing protein [Balneolaceae bacterium]|nr:MAG: T9SS C-terminal target domain-containing protein [Balneolaceae bacterium]
MSNQNSLLSFLFAIKKSKGIFFLVQCLLFATLAVSNSVGQTVSVGQASYSTTLSAGQQGPSLQNGQPAVPMLSESFNQPVQTSNFWSSILFPFFSDPHSVPIYAHPLAMRATSNGLQLGYTSQAVVNDRDYIFPFANHITVGVDGLNSPDTKTYHYGDWTVTAEWQHNGREMLATMGHGLPFVYFDISGGDAIITPSESHAIWHQEDEVLGITIGGEHYGVFAPAGSQWSAGGQFTSSLNGETYFSVAILPDNDSETLEFFRKRAYAFVTDTRVDWQYNEASATLNSTYTLETTLRDNSEGNLNETLTALYRHQWLSVEETLTGHTYNSPRGEMKLRAGNTFTTTRHFSGILPSLPDAGNYSRSELLALVQQAASGNLGGGPTYQNGKDMARFAHLIHIADQLGEQAQNAKQQLISKLKNRLETWFTAGGEQEYVYNDTWNVLTGYPSDHGANTQINDHHFHHAYAIMSAATIARFDPDWAAPDQWGGMVNLLIRDANNWDRQDDMFPFLRSFDVYAGHSWASGHGAFGDGNNQESSSEAMNFASAAVLWGEITNQPEIRDLGIYLYTTESAAIDQYWFDVDEEVFPSDYTYNALGIVWGNKGNHTTWFGLQPEFIHGINILPVHSGSFYLARNPDYIIKNFEATASASGGEISLWKDIFWKYLSMADAGRALSKLEADPNYDRFDGNSRAHTLHWIHNMKQLGQVDYSVHADIATYAVFRNDDDKRTYVAYNAAENPRMVTFSDGFSLEVGPREMAFMIADDVEKEKVEFPIEFDNEDIDWDDAFLNFNGGVSTVVANPEPTGENQTERVARMVKNEGEPRGGSQLILSEEIDTSEPLTILVWAPREESTLLFKIENSENSEQYHEINQTITASGEWVKLTYDFSGASSDFSYDSIVLIFDFETEGDGSSDFTWYYDQIGYLNDNDDDDDEEVPSGFNLYQNYPNPFNTNTQITYTLPEVMEISLVVYNMTGQRVATLVDGQQNAGEHSTTFDASNLASGIYIYRLTAGSFVETKKMVFVK